MKSFNSIHAYLDESLPKLWQIKLNRFLSYFGIAKPYPEEISLLRKKVNQYTTLNEDNLWNEFLNILDKIRVYITVEGSVKKSDIQESPPLSLPKGIPPSANRTSRVSPALAALGHTREVIPQWHELLDTGLLEADVKIILNGKTAIELTEALINFINWSEENVSRTTKQNYGILLQILSEKPEEENLLSSLLIPQLSDTNATKMVELLDLTFKSLRSLFFKDYNKLKSDIVISAEQSYSYQLRAFREEKPIFEYASTLVALKENLAQLSTETTKTNGLKKRLEQMERLLKITQVPDIKKQYINDVLASEQLHKKEEEVRDFEKKVRDAQVNAVSTQRLAELYPEDTRSGKISWLNQIGIFVFDANNPEALRTAKILIAPSEPPESRFV